MHRQNRSCKWTPRDGRNSSTIRAPGSGQRFAATTAISRRTNGPKSETSDLRSSLATPIPTTHGLQEGGCPASPHAGLHDVAIHIRGRYDRLGPIVPRRFPKLLARDEDQPAIKQGSGRMDLANWIA